MTVLPFPESGDVAVLARGDRLAVGGRSTLKLDGFRAVEPELDMITPRDDSGMIPLTRGHDLLVAGRRNQVVEGPDGAVSVAAKLRIRVKEILSLIHI